MKKTLLIATLFLLAACGHQDRFTLKGTLQNGAGRVVYLEELTPNGPLFIDSILLDAKGSFTYRYTPPYESFYNLHVSEHEYVVLLPQKGETLTLTGDYSNIECSYEVQGSPESALLWQIQMMRNEANESLRSILEMDHENRATLSGKDSLAAHEVTDSLFRETRDALGSFLTDFISRNRGSLSTIMALYAPFNGAPVMRPELNMEWYEEVLSGLEEMKPTNPHTQHFALSVAALRRKGVES